MTYPKIIDEMKARSKERIEAPLYDIRDTYRIVTNSRTPKAVAHQVVIVNYVRAEMPLEHYTLDQWIEMFRIGGHTAGAPDPSKPLTLYRGAHHGASEGISWSPSLAIAKYFAQIRGTKNIYQVQVTEPEVIFRYGYEDLVECMIDPRGRVIELLNPQDYVAVVDQDGILTARKKN